MSQRDLFTADRRLGTQLEAVRAVMLPDEPTWLAAPFGPWRTFHEIQVALQAKFHLTASEAAISARLRDLRHPEFGAHVVERRIRTGNLREYRVQR